MSQNQAMFCDQCEQTFQGHGCTQKGVCGKNSEVAALQDLLLHALAGIAVLTEEGGRLAVSHPEADLCLIQGLFTTVTNVNFDPKDIQGHIYEACEIRDSLRKTIEIAYEKKYGKKYDSAIYPLVDFKPAGSYEAIVGQALDKGHLAEAASRGDGDRRSLRQLLLYGLKGMAAYADHAWVLGRQDQEINAYFHKAMRVVVDKSFSMDELVSEVLTFGKINLKCMALLDQAHTERFGHPAPTKVSLGARPGPAILVSGHDLLDLEELLKQTDGKGINIYTHGEMLPAHGYPALKKYPHLAGNYGGAWQDQAKEFEKFPGPILMTTNCIQEPRPSYKGRIFTTGLVQWPGVHHIPAIAAKKDFSLLIKKAKELGGFKEVLAGKDILVGFGRNAVMSAADTVIGAVKAGKIKHFFLIGGCDGAKSGRNYFTEFAEKVPSDCLILTLACGKYRFNKLEFGAIEGLPRLLDIGQCNDAYSAVQIALALANAFKCGVNDLPLSLILSWYEQKAVCILITLLSLGIKNIRLGPSLPAFVSANVLKVLVDNFSIKPIGRVEEDLKLALGGK